MDKMQKKKAARMQPFQYYMGMDYLTESMYSISSQTFVE